MKKNIILVSFIALVVNGYIYAEPMSDADKSHIEHLQRTDNTVANQGTSEMQQALSEAMKKMHKSMEQSMASKDPDIAFAKGMIAHHLGAIDMAKIELNYGTDPEMRKLAQAIIDAQGPEIELMEQWLKTKSK